MSSSDERKLRFSDRIGATRPPDILQLDTISPELENSIWNLVQRTVFRPRKDQPHDWYMSNYPDPEGVGKYFAEFFFKIPVDTVSDYSKDQRPFVRQQFDSEKKDWWAIYNFLEFVAVHCKAMNSLADPDQFRREANEFLEWEGSGYRFLDGVLAPITNKEEKASIEEAIQETESRGFAGAREHLATAISLLSKKPDPDYRNSIKESISAIESLSKQITGEESGGLDPALNCLDKTIHFHGAFKKALSSLYGYTCDENGIRHAILDEPDVGFDEAKFMLIACSAFVNFIIVKAEKAGLIDEKQGQLEQPE